MIEVRPFESLGAADHGWLDARHHFSFAEYQNPARDNWGTVRVWNDDVIQPGKGFAPHGHKDMEIITYVREGAITHEDSMGNRGRTEAGDVQVMSAGTGVRHSEWNHESEPTTLFQIWIFPEKTGVEPAWGARPFPRGDRAGQFVALASGLGDADALEIQAPARVLGATLEAGSFAVYDFEPGRLGYMVPAVGRVRVNGVEANARDGIAIRDVTKIEVEALDDAELVMVDVPDLG
jgi:redox-sensitive bicupin YhaK (pirin superfamily)